MRLPHGHSRGLAPVRGAAVQSSLSSASQPEPGRGSLVLGESLLRWLANPWVSGLILVGAIFLAYQSAWRAGYVWDDDFYLTRNPLLTAPDGLRRIWFSLDSPSQYFPLVYTSFRFERALWGLEPAGYHFVNILLHAANATLLWRLLVRLGIPGAWLAAALFGLHPVQVESVAWITERKNTLCLFWSLLSLGGWLRFTEESSRRRWLYYGLSLFACLLALCSKTTACTLPAAFLLVCWLKGGPLGWRRVAHVIPFLLLGVGLGLVSIWWEQYHQGVKGHLLGFGPVHRLLIASRAVWFYAGKLVWPANLSFSYPRWRVDPSDPLAYGWLLAGAALAAGICYARRFWGRGPEVAALFHVVTLSPLLGFFMLSTFRYAFVADHYQYVACIGPLTLAAAGLTQAFRAPGRQRPWLGPVLGGVLLLVLGGLTWTHASAYANEEVLWQTTVAHTPGSFMAHNNLAKELMAQGDLAGAISHYRQAQALEPNEAAIADNLGNALLRAGQLEESIDCYRRALSLQPGAPLYCFDLANALLRQGRPAEAIGLYREALRAQPDAPGVAGALGSALLQAGQAEAAVSSLRQAVARAPGSPRAHSNLAVALGRTGRLPEAIREYETALALQPTNAITLNNLAWLLAAGADSTLRNGPRAVQLAEEASQISGGRAPQILKTLATAYAEAGRFDEAVATAQQALMLASVNNDVAYADSLRAELKLLQAKVPFHDGSLTNAPGK